MGKKYVIYGSMNGDGSDVQEVGEAQTRIAAEAKCEILSINPNNHPDLAFWWEIKDEQESK